MVNGFTSGALRQLARVFRDGTLSGLSDREILDRFVKEHDETAFEALVGRHGPMVQHVCRRILRDDDDADDAFQATFLALACKAGSLQVADSLGPWLYRVANRVAARARADRRRRGTLEHSSGSLPELKLASEHESSSEELPRVVHEELGRLPERLRAPIVLCYLEGMTHEQAASQLGWPVGTVRSRMARARALLHGRIARRGLATSSVAVVAVLSADASAMAGPGYWPTSLVEAAVRLAAGTAALPGGCGVPARVVLLLEGVLTVLKVKKLAASMAGLAALGIVAAVAGLSVFSAFGQSDGQAQPAPGARRSDAPTARKAAQETIVKTYYVGDLLKLAPIEETTTPAEHDRNVVHRRAVDMSPIVRLITATVAKGTWTIDDGVQGQVIGIDYRPLPVKPYPEGTRKFGTITPFFLSISLIVRHTPEVHDEVANLLRMLREVVEPLNSPDADGHETRADESKPSRRPQPAAGAQPASSGSSSADHTARIRQLVEELRQEVARLPRDRH